MFFKRKSKGNDSSRLSVMSSTFIKLKDTLGLPTNHEPKQLFKEIVIGSLFLYLILEILSNRSMVAGLAAPFENPLMFICNIGMIALTMSMGLLMPKRHIGYLLSAVSWLWLGTVNFILLGSRTTPLTAMDFKMLTSVFTVIGRYLSFFQMIFFSVTMILLLITIIIICIKLPRTKWVPVKGMIGVAFAYTMMMLSFQLALATGQVSRNFGNIAHAYLDYGFAYSFTTSVVDRGIQRPSTYSEKNIDELINSMKDKIDAVAPPIDVHGQEHFRSLDTVQSEGSVDISDTLPPTENSEKLSEAEMTVNRQTSPNIIMVQLETFFDVKRLNDYVFNQDPIPNFTRLSETFSSGFVTVPSIGAGTANTEFEILTGMNLDYFGAGEYPYKTILAKQTVESFAYGLSELGYHTHGIHNNMGTFYARHSVYPRLGFDGFTSIEYMDDVTYNPTGWAKDENLIPEIMKVLEHTDSADFVFAVSVQAHGKYPDEPLLEHPEITLTPSDWPALDTEITEAYTMSTLDYQYQYYVNQLYEVDRFVGDLVDTLEDYPEPVMVVFYGDHLPTFELDEDSLSKGTPFQTEYVIWDNMGLEGKDEDLMAYQLGAHVMEILDYDNGIINRYHQTNMDSPEYEVNLELLQYDLLYGDKEAYGGVNPFNKKKVSRGVNKASIKDLSQKGEALFINGEHFTEWSEVFMNGVHKETLFIDSETLLIQLDELTMKDTFTVSQITKTGRKLSSTRAYTYYSDDHPMDLLDVISDQYFKGMYESKR